MATSTTPTPLNVDPTEWDVVNDDGFVYKRKKRRLDPTSLARAPDPEPDPSIELKQRRKRKRQALLKLKEKYQRELSHWDILSNTLNAMQSSVTPEENQGFEEREIGGNDDIDGSLYVLEQNQGSLVQQLLLQVEAQEAVIRNFEQLCDVANALCDAQEEKANQQFFDLAVWDSPHERELMASLCEG